MADDFQLEVMRSLGRIEEHLKAQNGRVQKLEDDQVRHWWYTVAIGPVIAGLHILARKMGMDL